MSGNGLMQQWGVEAPKAGASDKQSKDFSADFKPGIKAIGNDIVALSDLATGADLKKLRDRSDAMTTAYQKVLKSIDPADPAKAKKDIKKVLTALDKLKAESAQQRDDTEVLYQDWRSYQAQAENQTRARIDALEIWGEPTAAKLSADLVEVDDEAQTRNWADARVLLYTITLSVDPLHEEYLKQKAAKAIYDIDRPAVDDRVQRLEKFETPTEKSDEILQSIIDGLDEVQVAAEKRDYITANASLKATTKEVGQLEYFTAEITAQKDTFGKRRQTAETELAFAAEASWDALANDAKELENIAKEADDLAKVHDFAKANRKLDDFEGKAAAFREEAQKHMSEEELFRARDQALQPRYAAVDDAPANNRGDGFKQFITAGRAGLEEQVSKGAFPEALKDLVEVEATLANFESYMVEFERDKADYLARLDPASRRLAARGEAVGEEMTKLLATTDATRKEMEEFAAGSQYDFARDKMTGLESQLAEYEGLVTALAEDKIAYDAERQELAARITVCSEVIDGNPKFAMVEEVTAKTYVAEAAAVRKEYQLALCYLLELREILVAAEQIRDMWAKKGKECDDRFAELRPRIDAAQAPIIGQAGTDLQATVEAHRKEARNWYDSWSYQATLDTLIVLEGALAEIEAHRTSQESQREVYDGRHSTVKARLDEIHGETGDEKIDTLMIGAIESLTDAESAAEAARFDEALNLLHEAAAAADSLAVARQDFAAEKQRYETRKKALAPRITEAMKPVYRDWAADMKSEVETLVDENAKLEELATFDPALANQDAIESNLASLEAAQAQDAADPITKDKLEAVVGESLDRLEPKIDGILALPEAVVDQKDKDRLKEWRDSATSDSALGALEDAHAAVQQIEALLAGCEVARQRYETAKSEYETRAKPLDPKISAIATVSEDKDHFLSHHAEPAYFAGLEMQNFAKATDYPTALARADRVEALMGAYEDAKLAHEQQEAAFKARSEPLAKPLREALSTDDGPWSEAVKKELNAENTKMVEQVATSSFDQALLTLAKLEQLMARYQTLAEKQLPIRAAYERDLPVILDRLVQLQAGPQIETSTVNPEFLFMDRDEMENLARAGDYQAALAILENIRNSLDAYRVLIDQRDELVADNKARLQVLDKRLARLDVWDGILNEERQAVASLITKAHGEELSPADRAILLDRTEAKMDGYEDSVHHIEEQKRIFEARFMTLAPRMDAVCAATPGEDWEFQHELLIELRETIPEIAERGGYDHVTMEVASLEELVDECEAYMKLEKKAA